MARNDEQVKQGREAEEKFIKLFPLVRKATKEEDIIQHWDVMVELDETVKNVVKVDVKGLKNDDRFDLYPNENIHWVEIQNVDGKTGWLYGESDLIAFETEDYFILVGTKKLRRFLERKMGYTKQTIKDIKPKHVKDPYVFFQRKGRKDIIVKVKTVDLMHIKYLSVEKNSKKVVKKVANG